MFALNDNSQGGVHLPPQEFHKAMEKSNTANHFNSHYPLLHPFPST